MGHEHQVVVMVVDTNAVIDPGAVMVIPFDADSTHVTVPGSRRANDLTVCTELTHLELLDDVQEIKFMILL